MLYVVATPIGDVNDISMRAVELLRSADMVIGEEQKEVTRLLKAWKATGRPIELLNEHSDAEDIEFLLGKCKELATVVLVSDCGTPGFCDPGALLVAKCRKEQVPVRPVPGASSLMALLSVSGYRLDHFLFRGFLPAKSDFREEAWQNLASEQQAIVLMDTPYRLSRTLDELNNYLPDRRVVIGVSLTQESESVVEGTAKELIEKFDGQKAEFILIVLPDPSLEKRRTGRGEKRASKRVERRVKNGNRGRKAWTPKNKNKKPQK